MKVAIEKNGVVKETTMSAFHNFFESSGWVVVGEDNSPITATTAKTPVEPVEQVADEPEVVEEFVEENADEADEEIADEEWEEAIAEEEVEKPLSEMNRDELVKKASSLGIDVTGKNNNQLRKMIKEVM